MERTKARMKWVNSCNLQNSKEPHSHISKNSCSTWGRSSFAIQRHVILPTIQKQDQAQFGHLMQIPPLNPRRAAVHRLGGSISAPSVEMRKRRQRVQVGQRSQCRSAAEQGVDSRGPKVASHSINHCEMKQYKGHWEYGTKRNGKWPCV